MQLGNWTNPEFEHEAYRVFAVVRPRYPKPLTVLELLSQVDKLSGDQLTILNEQWGGGGKLKSQFQNYIKQCSCNCWPSWKEAWKDFQIFMGSK